jgi:rubrerythrin
MKSTSQHSELSPGFHLLKETQSLYEILEKAMFFERTARDFYQELAEKVSDSIRPLVKELAGEEEGHYKLFQELYRHPYVQEHIATLVRTPPSDVQFTNYTHPPEIDRHANEKVILEYALHREMVAMQQYAALADNTPAGPVKDVFQYLAYEESEHIKDLEEKFNTLVQ